MRRSDRLALIGSLAVAASAASPAQAQTPLLGHYPPGQSGIRGAATPEPSFVITNFNRFFSNLEVVDGGGNVVQDMDEVRYANITMLSWTTSHEFLGMRFGMLAGIPFATGNLRPADTETDTGSFSLGDVLLTPLSLYGKSELFDYQFQFTYWSSSGRFEPGATTNRGTGFESLVYSLGGVFYPGGDRNNWSLSAVARLGQNFEQDGTGITPGDDLVLDWGIGRMVTLFGRRAELGVSGYGAWQLNDQSGPAGPPDAGRYHYFGIGPEGSIPLTKELSMRIRAQWEFGAQNLVSGNNLWVIFSWRVAP